MNIARILPNSWLFCLLGLAGHAAEITIDLSATREPAALLESGAKIKPLAGTYQEDIKDYRFENENVHWIFPEGIEFRQGRTSSIFTVKNGRLSSGSGISERIMPLEDALFAMQLFISKLKPESVSIAESKRLQEWYEVQRKKPPGGHIPDFGTGINSYRSGFKLAVHIHASFNQKYPVSLDLDFGWFDDSKIKPNAPPLDLNTGIIDLLPLGNKVYERAESANPTGIKYDPRFEAWLNGDRSNPEEIKRLVDDYVQDLRDRKSKSTVPLAQPPAPGPTNYVHLIWIPFAALVWWLYRKYRTLAKG